MRNPVRNIALLASCFALPMMIGVAVPTLAEAQELDSEALKLLAIQGAWEAEHAEYGVWSWDPDGSVCLRIGGTNGDCADTGTYEIADGVLCYALTWWGETVGERESCFTVQPIGDDRYETLFHGGAMVSRMFAFSVLD